MKEKIFLKASKVDFSNDDKKKSLKDCSLQELKKIEKKLDIIIKKILSYARYPHRLNSIERRFYTEKNILTELEENIDFSDPIDPDELFMRQKELVQNITTYYKLATAMLK